VGGIRKVEADISSACIKLPWTAMSGRAGKGELASSHVADDLGGRFLPKSLKKTFEIQFSPGGILGPVYERGIAPSVIRLPKKS
jgi:hypothetical protein